MGDFSTIVHPISKKRISIFSSSGRNLLKSYIQAYKLGGSRSIWSSTIKERAEMEKREKERREEAELNERHAREEKKAFDEWMRKHCEQELRELEQAKKDAKSWLSFNAWKAWLRGKDTDDVTTKKDNYKKCVESQEAPYDESRSPAIPDEITKARHEAEWREWGIDPSTMQKIPKTQEELERISARIEIIRKEREKRKQRALLHAKKLADTEAEAQMMFPGVSKKEAMLLHREEALRLRDELGGKALTDAMWYNLTEEFYKH